MSLWKSSSIESLNIEIMISITKPSKDVVADIHLQLKRKNKYSRQAFFSVVGELKDFGEISEFLANRDDDFTKGIIAILSAIVEGYKENKSKREC